MTGKEKSLLEKTKCVPKALTTYRYGITITITRFDPTRSLEQAAGSRTRLGNDSEYDKYAYTDPREDWAESFAAFIYPYYWTTYREGGEDLIPGGIRWTYVQDQIDNLP
jgi:hypothetical protein